VPFEKRGASRVEKPNALVARKAKAERAPTETMSFATHLPLAAETVTSADPPWMLLWFEGRRYAIELKRDCD
jgi:hypothetical protein